MINKFSVGDLVQLNYSKHIGIVLTKSNWPPCGKFAADSWAYKVKFIDSDERWEMEYSLELCGKVN
jgi:hypothetical protein